MGTFLMNHFTRSWWSPGGLVKLQTLKQILSLVQ